MESQTMSGNGIADCPVMKFPAILIETEGDSHAKKQASRCLDG